MYTDEDVQRSLRRLFSTMLGEPAAPVDPDDPDPPEPPFDPFPEITRRWSWRGEREEIADDARPVAVIQMGELSVVSARAAVPQGNVTMQSAGTITLYPPLFLDGPERSAALARKLKTALTDVVIFGIDLGMFESWGRLRPVSGPMRLPLWDYADVGVDEAGPEDPHDHMWVEDAAANALQDPLDPARWSVVLDFRITFERPGRVLPEAPIAQSMPGAWAGETPPA